MSINFCIVKYVQFECNKPRLNLELKSAETSWFYSLQPTIYTQSSWDSERQIVRDKQIRLDDLILLKFSVPFAHRQIGTTIKLEFVRS